VSYFKYPGVGCLLIVLPMVLIGQRAQQNVVPLKNWATPLYWQPNQGEREAARQAIPQTDGRQLVFSSNQVSNNALTFIAVTPCRLVDTRGGAFNGISPFSGPSIAPMTTATFPVQSVAEASANTAPAPCGTIPSIAQAYSFNITVVPHASGAVNYISIWPAGVTQPVVSTVDDVQGMIVANAAIVPAGTPMGGISVFNYGPTTTDVVIDMNGFFAAPSDLNQNTAIGTGTLASNLGGSANTATGFEALQSNTAGSQNTASGAAALSNNTTGNNNTASGANALESNTAGSNNTASGTSALESNTSGYANTASGASALQSNTTGLYSTATGYGALQNNTIGNYNTASGVFALEDNTTGYNNTASGVDALQHNTTGGENTATGVQALEFNTTGSNNIAIGWQAAFNVAPGNGSNIHIGSQGVSGDGAAVNSGVIRIGAVGSQTTTYIAGISGGTPGTPNFLVCVDGNGQLGTTGCSSTPSSRRFKEQITDMGDSSSKVFQLRPVTFLYRAEYDDGSHALQYGLIAEEVAKLYPEIVGYDKDGQPSSVKYQSLAPMLLNEVQKQNARVEKLEEQNRKLEERLAALEALLSSQTPAAARPASVSGGCLDAQTH
jgi:hypothetical protein